MHAMAIINASNLNVVEGAVLATLLPRQTANEI